MSQHNEEEKMTRGLGITLMVSTIALLGGCAAQTPNTITTRAYGEPIGILASVPVAEAQQRLTKKCEERGMKVIERTDDKLICGHPSKYAAGTPSEMAMYRAVTGRRPQEGMAFGFIARPEGVLVQGHEWREVENGGLDHELKVVRLTAAEPMADISAVLFSIGARNPSRL
jgi:hypothetical protein